MTTEPNPEPDLTPEQLEHMRIMAQAMRNTTPEQRRELDMRLYGQNPPLSVLLAAPNLLAALRLTLSEMEAMHALHHPRCEGGCPYFEAHEAACTAIAAAEPE